MSTFIKCMTCGKKVDNAYNWHCEDCILKESKKRFCNHMPKEQAYETTCIRCNTRLVAMDWRPA